MEERLDRWYIKDKKRYEEEKELIKIHCPYMVHCIDEKTGNAIWYGDIFCLDERGNLYPENCDYNPLSIKIECLSDYPKSIPLVYDVKEVLNKHNCTHIHPQSNKICYGLRGTKDKCNFHLADRIKDVVQQIGTFIYGQWRAENNGGDWSLDWKHGVAGIFQYESQNGFIPLKSPCPCGKGRSYLNCCLREVEAFILQIINDEYINRIDAKYGRRKKCPCNSGEKLKDCCEGRYVFYKNSYFGSNSSTRNIG